MTFALQVGHLCEVSMTLRNKTGDPASSCRRPGSAGRRRPVAGVAEYRARGAHFECYHLLWYRLAAPGRLQHNPTIPPEPTRERIMKAVVFHQHGPLDNIRYEDYPEPELGPADCLVAVKAVSLN